MDVRQQRSQARLFEAALRLAGTTPVSALTVTAIAQEAGVHRSTFYELATSPAAVVENALLAELDALRAGLVAEDATDVDRAVTAVTRAVLDHVRRHAAIYRRGLADDSGDASLHPMLAGHFRESSRLLSERARLRVDVAVPGVPADRVEATAIRFVASATVGAIEAWLETDELDVDAFLALYVRLLPAWWPRDLTAG
ncbi:TetR/AcrR family transcriptional regulator [Nocardioides sp.]|uniref:TetR/AcrR family transcriptional regulator n=1 Tax=Nocardioides sp. TaxID=35761 RepID=UPI00271DDDC6|nr:TetR/AcrR family transcriptional regulator [Nocardioides sp.]MDO9456053.1 TetR/AcrR family transcriptional regulator [Nocardioides sp.]